jgi:competence protein CoiA
MLYALVDGQKSNALPGVRGVCEFCKANMISKCGEFKTWHWAHKQNKSCDIWYETETEWHRKWKHIFGVDNCEIILEQFNRKHIADVRTIFGKVIEFQNSPIDLAMLVTRENFYGNDMIWVVNGQKFAPNFSIFPLKGIEYDDYTPEFDKFAKMHGFTPMYRTFEGENKGRFRWKRPKEVWVYAKAEVYIDFGDEYLFRIEDGKGCSSGIGSSISKRQFILQNGGDDSLVSILINQQY